ncbi:MAG TPA: hypothetical protein VMN36_13380 [Verrucomicrobiales bacterium]|nr:hypothetical protein [Verrucomicrobiales bacterium]
MKKEAGRVVESDGTHLFQFFEVPLSQQTKRFLVKRGVMSLDEEVLGNFVSGDLVIIDEQNEMKIVLHEEDYETVKAQVSFAKFLELVNQARLDLEERVFGD